MRLLLSDKTGFTICLCNNWKDIMLLHCVVTNKEWHMVLKCCHNDGCAHCVSRIRYISAAEVRELVCQLIDISEMMVLMWGRVWIYIWLRYSKFLNLWIVLGSWRLAVLCSNFLFFYIIWKTLERLRMVFREVKILLVGFAFDHLTFFSKPGLFCSEHLAGQESRV